jgi:hypothetical protein
LASAFGIREPVRVGDAVGPPQRRVEQRGPLGDRDAAPLGAVLIGERHDVTPGIDTRRPPRFAIAGSEASRTAAICTVDSPQSVRNPKATRPSGDSAG